MADKQNIVKETAKKLGLTQKELAEEIGVNEQTVGGWAREITPTPKWALKLFSLLVAQHKQQQENNKRTEDTLEVIRTLEEAITKLQQNHNG